MTININYIAKTRSFELLLSKDTTQYDLSLFKNLVCDCCIDPIFKDNIIILAYNDFIRAINDITNYLINHETRVFINNDAKQVISSLKSRSYSFSLTIPARSQDQIISSLNTAGFSRILNSNQINNLLKLSHLPAAATFSVPGAGKTTEALAFFFVNASPRDCLLVVCPLNAMGAWDEQMKACCPQRDYSFVRLRGGIENIQKLLGTEPRFMIISYQQVANTGSLLYDFLSTHNVFMFLDESHRIKRGDSGVITQEILKLSPLPLKKLIMSGTPCPQSINDLIPQFAFLYPEKRVSRDTVVDAFHPIFVRTTKKQLSIPKVESRIIRLEMGSLQYEVYKQLRSELSRNKLNIPRPSKTFLRNLGKKIMKIVEFVSNPSLLAHDLEYAFNSKIGQVLSVDSGPKIEYACRKARELAAKGEKVIIWSQFVRNVLLITERLKDIGADCIYGNISSGDEDEEDTREGKIKQFHTNPEKMVLVLNPSAAAEAISLHQACKHAIYVDRSFNAAHFLQSQDRIHRLGITDSPIIEILQCTNSIDEIIHQRLIDKIRTMSKALDDSSLCVESIPYDDIDSAYDYEGISPDDVKAVLSFFRAEQ